MKISTPMVNALLTPPSGSHKAQRGFTLVELAIVLVILGILVGGVLVGRDMIRNAEIKTTVEQKNNYISAITQFRDRFNALPGDFNRAGELWGLIDPDPATCWTTEATGKATCNGDNNGYIGRASWAYADQEPFRAWQHLANAELIEGRFIGIQGDTGDAYQNFKKGSLPLNGSKSNGWHLRWVDAQSGSTWYFDGIYKHSLITLNTFNAPELAIIDRKYDDGYPVTGKLVSVNNEDCVVALDGSVPTSNDTTAIYNESVNIVSCPYFIKDIIAR